MPKTKTNTKYKSKSNNKEKTKNNSKFQIQKLEEDSNSPIMSFLPKKIDLGRKKFLQNKPKHRNNKSIQFVHKDKISSDKKLVNENILNKSTKIENGDLHLHKLIEKITLIKNNEHTEGIILENLKKLRQYCYQLRKKRKKKRKMSVDKNHSRKKSKEVDFFIKRSTTIINKKVLEQSPFLIKQKMDNTKYSKSNLKNYVSPSSSPHFEMIMKRKSSIANDIKLNLNNIKYKINIIPPDKKEKKYSSFKNKDKNKKVEILNETTENKFVNKIRKKLDKKSFAMEKKLKTEENSLSIGHIRNYKRDSTINIIKLKNDSLNNENGEKNKLKLNKLNKLKISNKKLLYKNISINVANLQEKGKGFKYFNNLNIKNDKIELHDSLNKTTKKLKKYEKTKEENMKNNEENDEEIIKLKKMSIIIDSRKNLKKKLIDSPDRRAYRYSNFSNYRTSKKSNKYV